MNFLWRITLSCGIASLLLAGMATFFPAVCKSLGIDFWELPRLAREVERAEARYHAMDGETRKIFDRMERKDRLAEKLAEGDITLVQAAVDFRDIEKVKSNYAGALCLGMQCKSEDEALCRMMVAWTCSYLEDHNPQLLKVCGPKLEAELKLLLGRPGGVRLPRATD